jgi:VCBS repeat-containing protein
MGMSILWSQQTSIEDFAEEILRHIDAALYVDRTTGKFVLKLIRADYIESSLLVLDQSNISRGEGYTKQTLAELVNEITVTYDSNETGQAETVTLQNLAMIQQQGAIIQATVDYPGFAHQRIAAKVAARDLKAMSTPLASATLYANREAAGLNIGSVFRWNWVEQDEDGNGIATSYIMRVTEIAFGDGVDNTVRIQCAQDVFALPDIVYVEAEPTEWTDPTAAPLPATPRLVTETPYYEIVRRLGEVDAATKLTSLPELGYLMVAAGRPAAEINAELQVDSGAGYVEGGTLDFCPCAKLDGDVGFLDTSATLKDGVDLDEFVAGSLAQIDDEIIVVESIVDGVATIRRGCLDTVPAAHADGSAVIIWDGYTASDDVEYVASDDVDVKILTITGQGPLSLLDAPVDSVVMDQRAIRPYPPANVKINDQYYPDLIETTPDLTVTWAHRDRLQQTGGTVLGWTDASVGPESGVNYGLRLVRDDTDEELVSATDVAAAVATLSSYYSGDVRLELWAMRDGLSSLQKWMHTFVHHPAGAFNDLATCYRGDTATGNVLDNDTSVMTAVSRVAGDSANIGIAVAGSNGGLFTISSDGSWFFDPNGDFDLLDEGLTAETSVTYHATNGSSESSATLTVTITTLNWWTPEELGGAVYFDPDFLDLMTLDGTAITALRSVYNAAIELTQGTSTARPQLLSGTLNGANEISFDGGDFLQTDTSLGFGSSPVTFFLVEREMSGGIGAAPLSFNSGPNGGIVFQKNTTGLQPFSPNIPFESTQERILMYVRPQQGVAYCAKDGVITGTDDTTTGTYGSSFALGKRLNGGYLLGGGKITAALMIPRLLKNTEIAKVVGYLAHAKGITGNLQASHPYKTEKPVVEIYSGPTDPYWSNVVLCLNADGYNGDRGVDDAKGKQVFPFGNTQIITSPGYNAIRLDDSGDYAKVNAHTDFDFGSADWCVEGWIYRYALGGGFFVQRGWGVSQGIFLVFNSSGNLEIQLGNGSWFFSKTATITAGLNTLFHVAVVRNGAAIKVYQNGVEVMSQPVSGTLSSGLGAFVGADPGNSYYALNCHIKGLRVTKGVPRYTAAFTPEAAPFPIA